MMLLLNEICSVCGNNYDLRSSPLMYTSERMSNYLRSCCSMQCLYYYLENRNSYVNICIKSKNGLHHPFKQFEYWSNKITGWRFICTVCKYILREENVTYFDSHCEMFREYKEELKIKEKERRRKSRKVSGRDRHRLFKKYNYRCSECGQDVRIVGGHIDHIKPVSKGGTNEFTNLQLLCVECNLAKHVQEWIGGLEEIK